MQLHLGKQPARSDDRDLRLATYTKPTTVPVEFGHETFVRPAAWGMLGNDEYGDCAWAGPAHETMLLTHASTGKAARFTTRCVLADYSAATGFDLSAGAPGSNPTDEGTDMRVGLNYRRKIGIRDATGAYHRIAAYAAISDVDELARATYLFGAAAVGIRFPDSAMDQFNAGQPWTVQAGAQVDGGHYVPCVGRRRVGGTVYLEVVTWGRLQLVAPEFLATYLDEAYAVLSPEYLHADRSPEGLDLAALKADLAALAR